MAQDSTRQPEAPPAPTDLTERIQHERWKGDLDDIVKRRILRVLVIPDKLNFFFDGSQMHGASYDGLMEFERFLNKKLNTGKLGVSVVCLPMRRDEILNALNEGRGDFAAAGLGVSEQRLKLVEFSDPVRDGIKVVPVTDKSSPPIRTLDDLAGKEVYVPVSSVFPELIAKLNERFRKEGKPEVRIQPADENLEPADILEMVNAGLVKMTLADDLAANFWAKVLDQLQVHPEVALAENGAMAWAFRNDTPKLKALANEFIKDHRVGTAFGSTVLRKYTGSTKWVKNATSDAEMKKFRNMAELFRKYGSQYDLPYLLVAAQAYQESRLNNELRSPAGAVGVMQIKPSTAAGHPINVNGVEQVDRNILAGTKYLRFLVNEYFKEPGVDRLNRGLFAVASYNAGPNRIQQLRKKAKDQGLDSNRWFNNVELVAAKEIGRETVTYVSNIYKYYLAYTMTTERSGKNGAPAAKK